MKSGDAGLRRPALPGAGTPRRGLRDPLPAFLSDTLARGESIRLRVQGVSMLPWLPEGRKVRILPAAGRILHRGDIALFLRPPAQPILHRILCVRRNNDQVVYECLGDSEHGSPERVPARDVLGVVEMTRARRTAFLWLHPARRAFNRLCSAMGLHLGHG